MWGFRSSLLAVFVVLVGACTAAPTVPTLPPLDLPETAPAPPVVPESLPEDVPVVELPEALDIGALDVFGRLDVDAYEVELRLSSGTLSDSFLFSYRRNPEAGSAVGSVEGEAIAVVVIGEMAWLKPGPTPNDAFVVASTGTAAFAADIVDPDAYFVETFAEFDVELRDFVYVGPGEFAGVAANEYGFGGLSVWTNDEGVLMGGAGSVQDGPEVIEVALSVDWSSDFVPIEPPSNTISEEEFEAYLAATDQRVTTTQLRTARTALAVAKVDTDTYAVSTATLQEIEPNLVFRDGLADLEPGDIGTILSENSGLLVARMLDGRHFCVAVVDGEWFYGGGYELSDVDTIESCSDPDDFPQLSPPPS